MYFRPFIGIISPTAMGQPGQKGLSQDAGLHVPLLRGGGVDPSEIYIWVVATQIFVYVHPYLDVSENSGTPKSSKLIRFSIINHPFWGNPIFGNTHLGKIPMLTNIFQMGWNHQPDIYDMVILFARFERVAFGGWNTTCCCLKNCNSCLHQLLSWNHSNKTPVKKTDS